jgi:hypothetical protein
MQGRGGRAPVLEQRSLDCYFSAGASQSAGTYHLYMYSVARQETDTMSFRTRSRFFALSMFCFVALSALTARGQESVPAQEQAVPYRVKDFVLGMSVEDFVKMVPPQMTWTPKGSFVSKKQELPCWNGDAHRTYCNWPRLPLPTIANVTTWEIVASFFDGRMYQVRIEFVTSDFAQVRDALAEKFGDPAQKTGVTYATAFRNVRGDVIKWENPVSYISLYERWSTTRNAALVLQDKKVAEQIEALTHPKTPDL